MKRHTIIFIPNAGAKCKRFNISQPIIILIGFVFLCFACTFGHLAYKNKILYKQYMTAQLDHALMESYKKRAEKIETLIAEVSGMQEKVNKLTTVNSKLQNMVGLGSKDISVGGGSMTNDFEDVYSLNKSKLLSKLENEIDNIQEEATKQANISQSLTKFLDQHEIMRAHMPTKNPLPSAWISSYFGHRIDPFTGKPSFHSGLDMSEDFGTAVVAPADGIVTYAGYNGTYGRMLKISHNNDFQTCYGHLKSFRVTVGAKVHKGDIIGYVGMSGKTTGPHLHYEIHFHNQPVNPLKFMVEE
jgi:murein DD-endopeptidase MepM/ murein hydrolase activator NlpD